MDLGLTERRRSRLATSEARTAAHLELGRRGEALAAAYLELEGYSIVGANFSLPVGRNLRHAIVHAEIDLVAYEGPTLCFIEVKTRASDWFAQPQANVDLRKRRQIVRAARAYRRMLGLTGVPHRYDVVTVVLGADRRDADARADGVVRTGGDERAEGGGRREGDDDASHASHDDDPSFEKDSITARSASAAPPRIEILRNFWTEQMVRKRQWSDHFYY